MIGADIYQACLQILRASSLKLQLERSLIACLEAAQPGPLPFLNEAAWSVELQREERRARSASIFLFCAAVNLLDDLMDEDCDYLPHPHRDGPDLQILLHALAWSHLQEHSPTSPQLLAEVQRRFANASAAQFFEVRRDPARWNAARYDDIARAIAGDQWAAYLQILWAGTPLQSQAATLGEELGWLSHLALDWSEDDPRLRDLPEAEQQVLRKQARDRLVQLQHHRLPLVQRVIQMTRQALELDSQANTD